MKNIFKFYEGKEYNKHNKKATKEILKEVKNFKIKVREIMDNYEFIGATDTQSREEIIRIISNKINEGF